MSGTELYLNYSNWIDWYLCAFWTQVSLIICWKSLLYIHLSIGTSEQVLPRLPKEICITSVFHVGCCIIIFSVAFLDSMICKPSLIVLLKHLTLIIYFQLMDQEILLCQEYVVEDRENNKNAPELDPSHVTELRMLGLY